MKNRSEKVENPVPVFLSPKGRVVSGRQVRVSSAPVVIGAESAGSSLQAASDQHSHSSANVTAIRDPATQDVTQIRIECACGETILLDLTYGPSALHE